MRKNRIKIEKILLSNILNEIFLCFYYIKRVKKIEIFIYYIRKGRKPK